jgi:hypothetical protein
VRFGAGAPLLSALHADEHSGNVLGTLGNPEPFAITPFFNSPYTESMNIFQRAANAGLHLFCKSLYALLVATTVQPTVNKSLGPGKRTNKAFSNLISLKI